MRTTIHLLASAVAGIATPALAQDAGFVGPRIEATVGYDSARSDDHVSGTPDTVKAARLGLAAGYDIGLGPVLRVGVEGGVGWSLGDGRTYSIGTTRANVDTGRDLDLSLRLGARVGLRTLVYAKAGWANSGFSARITDGTTSVRTNSHEDGVRAGVGIEHMFGDHVYAKGEYRYTAYGNDVSRHQALLGVGYRF